MNSTRATWDDVWIAVVWSYYSGLGILMTSRHWGCHYHGFGGRATSWPQAIIFFFIGIVFITFSISRHLLCTRESIGGRRGNSSIGKRRIWLKLIILFWGGFLVWKNPLLAFFRVKIPTFWTKNHKNIQYLTLVHTPQGVDLFFKQTIVYTKYVAEVKSDPNWASSA